MCRDKRFNTIKDLVCTSPSPIFHGTFFPKVLVYLHSLYKKLFQYLRSNVLKSLLNYVIIRTIVVLPLPPTSNVSGKESFIRQTEFVVPTVHWTEFQSITLYKSMYSFATLGI